MIRNNPCHDTAHPAGCIVHPVGQQWKEIVQAQEPDVYDGVMLLQDHDRKLSKALANTPNARQEARDSADSIKLERVRQYLRDNDGVECQGFVARAAIAKILLDKI